MQAEFGFPAMVIGEKPRVICNVFHAISRVSEDFGEKRVVMDAFVVASFVAPVADTDKRGDFPPGFMDAGECLVVILKKEEAVFPAEAEEASAHGGKLLDRVHAMAREALLEFVPEALSSPRTPTGFVRENKNVGIKSGHDPRRAVSATRVEAQLRPIGAKAFQDDVWVMGWHGLLIGSCGMLPERLELLALPGIATLVVGDPEDLFFEKAV